MCFDTSIKNEPVFKPINTIVENTTSVTKCNGFHKR